MRTLMFATGIEGSYPTVQDGKRRDLMAETGHYDRWEEDFRLAREIGAKYLRYGPPYYRMHTGPDRYDWSFTDEVLPALRKLGIEPILHLCHFGVPDWVGGFQNEEWPALFADYAAAFCRRYPWITLYMPVNEISVCARFSGHLGFWNEQLKSDRAMVRAQVNMCRAALLAAARIRETCPGAVFFQSDAAQAYHERWPEVRDEVRFQNQYRFLTFDLLNGHPPDGDVVAYLLENGVSADDYRWFMHHGREMGRHGLLGLDYYRTNETVIHPDGEWEIAGPALGWYAIVHQYYRRYRKPIMLTETSVEDPTTAVDWLWKTWDCFQWLRADGIPLVGYTWFGLIDQVDWDSTLREIRGNVFANGLYTLERKPREAAGAFRQLTGRYGHLPLLAHFPAGLVAGD